MRARAVLVLLAALLGCDTTGVRRQAQAADAVARAFNQLGRPALVGAYEASCRTAINAACPRPPCAREPMVDALQACDARWRPAFVAYEAARAAHGAWRATLVRCQGAVDGGGCGVDLARDAATFMEAAGEYRCAVRALGRADLDPIPGPAACPAGDADGG